MAEIREKLVLEDRFSGTLNQFSNQMSAAARMAGSGYTAMTATAEQQARAAQAAASAVAQTQYDANAAIASTGQYFASTGQQAAMYAQRIVQNEAQLRQLNMTLQLESQRLAEIAAAQGSASAAARQQNDAVRRLMGTIQGVEYANLQFKTSMDRVAGSTRAADKMLEGYRRSAEGAGTATSGLMGKLKGLVGGFALVQGVKSLFGMSDAVTQTRARLDMMNDGLQTTERLNQMIYQSAQRSRGAYAGTADMVAKLGVLAGNAFASNAEVVAFAEQLNKHFTISGTAAAGQQAAMLQLTQAMSSGVLRGEELRSVMEQVPTVTAAIAQALGVSTGEMRELAAEGQISAQVVKAAMFAAADETNAKFATMPMTWSQVWTGMQNTAVMALQPVLNGINWLANNMKTLAPIAFGAAAGVVAFALGSAILSGALGSATVSALGFTAALLANPLTWVALGIGLVVGLIFKWVQATGGIKVAWAKTTNMVLTAMDNLKIGFFRGVYFVQNLLDKMSLAFQTAGTNIQNFLGDMKAGALSILQNMVNGAINIINDFIGLLNKIPGVNIGVIGQVTFGASAAIENEAAKQARNANLAAARQAMAGNVAARDAALSTMENEAWKNERSRLLGISAMRAEAAAKSAADAGIPTADYSALLSGVSDIAGNTSQIARNTAVDPSDEDLKYLEDVAIRRYEARVNTTQLAPNITVQVSGRADKSMGVDIANTLKVMLAEQLASHTTATYAGV